MGKHIRTTTQNRGWCTPAVRARLGMVPDARIAKEVGVCRGAVRFHRERLGIPRCPRGRERRDLLELVGTMPDVEVARRLGLPRQTVWHVRQQLGRPVFTVERLHDGEDVYHYNKGCRCEPCRRANNGRCLTARRGRVRLKHPAVPCPACGVSVGTYYGKKLRLHGERMSCPGGGHRLWQ